MKAENIPVEYTGAWTAPAKDCDENAQGSPFAAYMYGLFMMEVGVDMASGKARVTKATAVADIGKINNRLVGRRPDVRRSRPGHRPGPDRGLRRH